MHIENHHILWQVNGPRSPRSTIESLAEWHTPTCSERKETTVHGASFPHVTAEVFLTHDLCFFPKKIDSKFTPDHPSTIQNQYQ